MKHAKYSVALGFLAVLGLTACSDRNNASDSDASKTDTTLTDTRRNTTDTVNYLTKDSGNQSQPTIEMDAPTNSRY